MKSCSKVVWFFIYVSIHSWWRGALSDYAYLYLYWEGFNKLDNSSRPLKVLEILDMTLHCITICVQMLRFRGCWIWLLLWKSGGASFAISQVIIVKLFTFDAYTLLLLFELSALFICFYICAFDFCLSIPLLLLESFCVNFMYVFVIYEALELLASLLESFQLLCSRFVDVLLMFSSIVLQSFPLCYFKSFNSFATNVLIIDILNVFIKREALRFWCVDYLQTKSLCISKAFSIWLNCLWS